MWVIIIFLLAGLLVGYFELLPAKCGKHIDGMMMNAMLLLLFVMGMQMGSSEEIWSNLFKIGFNSFVLAALAVAGSVAALYFTTRIFLSETKESVSEND